MEYVMVRIGDMEGGAFTFGVKNFFGDQRNGIGDGEDLRGGGGCIYIWCQEFFWEINEME